MFVEILMKFYWLKITVHQVLLQHSGLSALGAVYLLISVCLPSNFFIFSIQTPVGSICGTSEGDWIKSEPKRMHFALLVHFAVQSATHTAISKISCDQKLVRAT